jgi:hypothetical protein
MAFEQLRKWVGPGLRTASCLKRQRRNSTAFLTVDRNLQFQQAVDRLPLAVIVIRANDNRLETLRPLMPAVHEALASIAGNELKLIGV